jgi:glycosyltransferase involved in cell wall biosynthesis
MISVLTLTYKRPHLLEEAIESFLRQYTTHPKEMVIINDNKDVDYVYNHPDVTIINCKERFSSVSKKLQWGFTQCKYDYIYRLDDDDLLTENGLQKACDYIINNPGYDIYRASGFYFFVNNKLDGWTTSINNGNIYSKSFVERIEFPDTCIGEDADITFHKGGTWWEPKEKDATMIYRWGMGTLHISGMGNQPNDIILNKADKVLDNRVGTITLHPKFLSDYYEQIKKAPI